MSSIYTLLIIDSRLPVIKGGEAVMGLVLVLEYPALHGFTISSNL
jgi:hypothetical protein